MKYLIFLLSFSAFAGGSHHNINETIINESIVNEVNRGVALGLASSALQFDLNTNGLQWSAGAGFYDGSEAATFGLGKRFGKTLINGSVGIENGQTGLSLGISGKF